MAKYEYLLSQSTYIYPSSNSDDGGDVNSEQNLAGILKVLASKNFVVVPKQSWTNPEEITSPLNVTLEGDTAGSQKLTITSGRVVIEGYAIEVKDEVEIVLQDEHYDNWLVLQNDEYVSAYSNYISSEGTDSKEFSKYCIYLVASILRDTTGNIRGDVTGQVNGEWVRQCKGLCFSFKQGVDIAKSDLPLAQLVIDPGEVGRAENALSAVPLVGEVVNTFIPDKYAIFDIRRLYTEEGTDIISWLKKEVNLKVLTEVESRLSSATTDEELPDNIPPEGTDSLDGYTYTDGTWTRNGTSSRVARADHSHDHRYLVKDCADSQELTGPVNFKSSVSLKSGGNVNGVAPASGTTPSNEEPDESSDNGQSTYLARADHTHDRRYLRRNDVPQQAEVDITLSSTRLRYLKKSDEGSSLLETSTQQVSNLVVRLLFTKQGDIVTVQGSFPIYTSILTYNGTSGLPTMLDSYLEILTTDNLTNYDGKTGTYALAELPAPYDSGLTDYDELVLYESFYNKIKNGTSVQFNTSVAPIWRSFRTLDKNSEINCTQVSYSLRVCPVVVSTDLKVYLVLDKFYVDSQKDGLEPEHEGVARHFSLYNPNSNLNSYGDTRCITPLAPCNFSFSISL